MFFSLIYIGRYLGKTEVCMLFYLEYWGFRERRGAVVCEGGGGHSLFLKGAGSNEIDLPDQFMRYHIKKNAYIS